MGVRLKLNSLPCSGPVRTFSQASLVNRSVKPIRSPTEAPIIVRAMARLDAAPERFERVSHGALDVADRSSLSAATDAEQARDRCRP